MRIKRIILLSCLLIFISICCIKGDESPLIYLYDYQKEYIGEDIEVCSSSSTKTYMSYKAITDTSSTQYRYIEENMSVDPVTGLLVDEEGFIGVALGSYFGDIGTRYYITLDTGIVLPVVKVEAKSDKHTNNGCAQSVDGSVIEFVIDVDIASSYFGISSNGYVLSGNFNNFDLFSGEIIAIEKVTDTPAIHGTIVTKKVTNISIIQKISNEAISLTQDGLSIIKENDTTCSLNKEDE